MNREGAETYLRLVAEAELRRAATPPRDGTAIPAVMPVAEPGALVVLRRSAVAAALYDLPVRQREVIALQYYAGLSETETAAALHITRGAVHSHTAHGMSALRAALQAGTSSPVARAAQVLTAAGAIDPQVADQILDGFVLALGARRAGPAGQPGPDPRALLRSPAVHLPLGMLIRSRPAAASGQAAAGSSTSGGGRARAGQPAGGSRPGHPAGPGNPGPRRRCQRRDVPAVVRADGAGRAAHGYHPGARRVRAAGD